MAELGVPLAHEKTNTEGPTTKLSFRVINLDTVATVTRLPQGKLYHLRDMLTSVVGRNKVTLGDIQALLGYLNFACTVIVAGRAFCRGLSPAIAGTSRLHHHISISREW